MTQLAVYRCNQCGHRFETPILSERERREAEKDKRPVFAVQCPRCSSRNLQQA